MQEQMRLGEGHTFIEEPGVLYCECGEWWVQVEDGCNPNNEHYELWRKWYEERDADKVPFGIWHDEDERASR